MSTDKLFFTFYELKVIQYFPYDVNVSNITHRESCWVSVW